jgi:hypothetical protein
VTLRIPLLDDVANALNAATCATVYPEVWGHLNLGLQLDEGQARKLYLLGWVALSTMLVCLALFWMLRRRWAGWRESKDAKDPREVSCNSSDSWEAMTRKSSFTAATVQNVAAFFGSSPESPQKEKEESPRADVGTGGVRPVSSKDRRRRILGKISVKK